MKLKDPCSFNVGMIVVFLLGCVLAWSIEYAYNKPAQKLSPAKQKQVDLVADTEQNDNPAMLAPSVNIIPPTPEQKAAMKEEEAAKKAEMAKLLAQSKPIPMKLIKGTLPLAVAVSVPPGGVNTGVIIYDLGRQYKISSFSVLGSHTIYPGTITWHGSNDGISWFGGYSLPPPPLTQNFPSSWNARYIKIEARIFEDSEKPRGLYSTTISEVHLYGKRC